MKKLISVLVVLCLAMTLFAAGSVRVGGSFNFLTGKSAKFSADAEDVLFELANEKVGYKAHGFGFDVAGDYDVASNLSVWADFNMVFCADAKYKVGDADEESFDDAYKYIKNAYDKDAKKAINIISISSGVAYKLDFNPVVVKLGGGLFFERSLACMKYKPEVTPGVKADTTVKFKTTNFGVAFYGDVEYKFNEQFGLGLTVMPHVGLINTTSASVKATVAGVSSNVKDSKTGVRLSFSMPIVVGVSYSF